MTLVDYLYLMLMPILLSIGQVLFKKTASVLVVDSAWRFLASILTSPWLWAALFVYGAGTLLWVFVLSRVELGRAIPFVALTFIIVPAVSTVLFNERFTPMYWVGILVIAAGVCITVSSPSSRW